MTKFRLPKWHNIAFFSLLIVTIFTIQEPFANQLNTHFKINQLDGLSSDKVTSIAKDRDGVYWVGTRKGLNQIVNNRVTHFDESYLFTNREIKFIFRDALDNMWVASSDNLYRYDCEEKRFETISTRGNYNSANSIGSVANGVVICRRDQIEIYRHDNHLIETLEIEGSDAMEFNSMCVIDDDNILLYCSQSRNLYRLNIHTAQIDPYEKINLPARLTNYRDKIYIDSKGRLWLSIYNRFLGYYSLEGEGSLERLYSVERGNLSQNIVLDIIEYNGKIIVATDGGGINTIDPESGASSSTSDLLNLQSMPYTRSTYTLFADPEDGLFLGTIRDGLLSIRNSHIQSFSNNAYHLSSNNRLNYANAIHCFSERGDQIWIGTDGDGIWIYDRESQIYSQIESTKGLKITDISNIDNKYTLISVYSKGVFRLNNQTGHLEQITIVNDEINNIIAEKDMVVSLSSINGSMITIVADYVYVYDARSNSISKVESMARFDSSNIFLSGEDATNLYAHSLYSVYAIRKGDNSIRNIYSINSGNISSVRKSNDALWIVRNYSLYKYDLKSHTEALVASDFANLVMSIELGAKENIWVTTFNKVVSVEQNNPESYIFFDEATGYERDEYLPRAVMTAANGDIYFGGNNGFVTISHEIPIKADEPKPISLHSVKIEDELADIVEITDWAESPKITAPWNYSSMNIEVYTDDRNIFHNNKFQYTITSNGKSTTLNSDNRLSLQTLSAGHYDIEVAYLNNDGEWCSNTKLLEITITPPWWSSTPFRAFMMFAVIMLILLFVYLYSRSRSRQLTQLHFEREQELLNNKIKFLINISHELRTPLTLIYAPLKRLLESESIEGDNKRVLTNIFGQSRYMTELINMVLDARRMEAGYGEIEITPHDFNEWVSAIAKEFEEESAERNIKLKWLLDPQIKSLNFDGPKCRTVLSNLLMNALRYSKGDGTGEIIIRSERFSNSVRLSVIDNGIGLVGVDIDSLFNRFVRVNNQTTGSGIGLSYSKTIIEQHSGASIGAYCNSAQGATFFFEIPIGLECKKGHIETKPYLANMLEDEVAASNVGASLDYSLAKHTILIVDDQPELLSFMNSSLKSSFKRVYTATNGVEAYEKIKQHQPSIIVSDVMMPEMDGYQLSYKVKNDIEVSHIPIILLTAKADAGSKVMGYKSGADVYISKPFDIAYLLSVISSQLNSRDISRRRYSQLTTEIKAEEITYSNADEQFVIKLNDFILENMGNTIDVGSIANYMCMSRAALYKKLKSIIDIGAMEYVTKIRMTHAADKIRNSTTSITEIAMQCGYTDNQYFSKAFKQFHNVSPSQYRKGSETPAKSE